MLLSALINQWETDVAAGLLTAAVQRWAREEPGWSTVDLSVLPTRVTGMDQDLRDRLYACLVRATQTGVDPQAATTLLRLLAAGLRKQIRILATELEAAEAEALVIEGALEAVHGFPIQRRCRLIALNVYWSVSHFCIRALEQRTRERSFELTVSEVEPFESARAAVTTPVDLQLLDVLDRAVAVGVVSPAERDLLWDRCTTAIDHKLAGTRELTPARLRQAHSRAIRRLSAAAVSGRLVA